MPTSQRLSVNKLGERGFAQIFVILILILGIVGGLYLVKHPQIFKPKAANEGTRIEIFGPGVSADKTTSRDIKLRIIYVQPSPTPSPSPTPTPTPSPTPKPLPAAFSRDWSVNWEKIPAGSYSLSFAHANGTDTDASAKLPANINLEVKEKATTEVKVSSDGKNLDCGQAFCVKYYPDNNIASGQLRVETIPARGFKITVTASSVLGISTSFPTHFRIANSQSELSSVSEQVFDMNGKIIDWTLTAGNGLKTVYAQFKVDGVWDSETIISTQINLAETQLPVQNLDLKQFYPNGEMVDKGYYLAQNDPLEVLWFERQDQYSFKMYNSAPFQRCHYDLLSWWDDNTLRYAQTHDECNAKLQTDIVYDPPIIFLPRYFDTSKGMWSLDYSAKVSSKENGAVICTGVNNYQASIVDTSQNKIHWRTKQHTTWDKTGKCKDWEDTNWQEDYYLDSNLAVAIGGSDKGLSKSVGGNRKFNCDQWDITYNNWLKLPAESGGSVNSSPSNPGYLTVLTDPAVGAEFEITNSEKTNLPPNVCGQKITGKWGLHDVELKPGKYFLKITYPYPKIYQKNTKIPPVKEIQINSGQDITITADLTQGIYK